MVLDWLAQMPSLLTAALIIFAPGMVAFACMGVRGLPLLASAPLFSVAATGVTALGAGAVGVPWSPLVWLIAMAILIGIAFLIGRLLGRNPTFTFALSWRSWILVAAVCAGALITSWRLAAYISDPEAVSQTNDAVFHMNAVRYILETADASSLHVNAVIDGASFYPAAWHAIVSLVVMVTGASITVATNAFTIIIGSLIWTLGIAWLTRMLTGSSAIAGFAAVLSGALHAFPLLMFQWGVLFPNALSIALIPAAIALVVSLPGWNQAATIGRAATRSLLMIAVAGAALVLSQPAAAMPWTAICMVWFTFWAFRRQSALTAWSALILVAVGWAATVGVWLYLANGTSGSHWPPSRGKLEAIADILLNGQVRVPIYVIFSALMITGLVIAIARAEYRWFAVSWFGISFLFFLVAAVGHPFVRDTVLGGWYADPYRLAALAPVTAIPLAAIGVNGVRRLILRWTARRRDETSGVLITTVATVVYMLILVMIRPTAMPAFMSGSSEGESRYASSDVSFLSLDERQLLEELEQLVPEDAVVLGNPGAGSGFGYFLSGVDVFPRTWSPPSTDSWQVIASHLRDVANDPAVCVALSDYDDPEYVLDFGPGEQGAGRYEMPGMTDFDGQDGFDLIASEGDVSLWRITACEY